MRFQREFTVAAASLTGHASNVTGAEWAIATASAGDGLAHKVTIRNDSATDHGAKTVTLTGSGANGEAITETLAAPAGSATVTSTKAFKVLDSAVPSATIGADTFDIGWVAAGVSPWVELNQELQDFNVSVAVAVGGTINYDVQHTYHETFAEAVAFNHSGMTANTASDDGQYICPVSAVRVNVNSHTSGTFELFVVQGERS
jgi:hypothetical protein